MDVFSRHIYNIKNSINTIFNIFQPFQLVSVLLQWLCGQLAWVLFQANLSFLGAAIGVCSQPMDDDDGKYNARHF